ncbi:MAG: MoaD/ThiS family protein [Candidatus Hydrothermarchaeales archaeon]
MSIEVQIIRGKTLSLIEVEPDSTIADLMEQIGVNRETVLTRLNDEVAVEEERLKGGDVVEIIMAISGG